MDPPKPNLFLELLSRPGPITADGAMGTSLMELGLASGEAPESWNQRADRRDLVGSIHAGFVAAGAQIVLTNSFGGNPLRLARHGLSEQVFELNRAAARIARTAVGPGIAVAGSMGPCGEFLYPLGDLSAPEVSASFARQAAALAAGDVDLLWIETMAALDEAEAALIGARAGAPGLPIVVTLTFDRGGRTMMGVSPIQAARALNEWGLAAWGANCGSGGLEMEQIIEQMIEACPEATLVAKGNAGSPRLTEAGTVYDLSLEQAAEQAGRLLARGVRIIGGCCGTKPAHLRAISKVLRAVAD